MADKRVAVIQSSYIPWRGYFDVIRSVDLFVLYDDVQYSKGSWRNRNRLKTSQGLEWITVPVHASLKLAIDETRIDGKSDWRRHHRRQIEQSLGPAPHFEDARRLWEDGAAAPVEIISDLNIRLIRAISEYLGITTPMAVSRNLATSGRKNEKLLELLVKVGATTYVSGPTAKGYLDVPTFHARGLRLEYKSYDYAPYPQLWGPFEGAVSILDLIANVGKNAGAHARSRSANEVVQEESKAVRP